MLDVFPAIAVALLVTCACSVPEALLTRVAALDTATVTPPDTALAT